jgi:hypothetical protein
MHALTLTDDERAEGALAPERLATALRTFRDTGLITIAGAYETEFLATVRLAYDVLLEKHIAARGGWKALDGKTFGEKHIGFFPPLFAPLADERIAAHPVVVQLLDAFLGGDPVCSFYHTNTAYPGSGYQPIHRDSGHLFGTEFDGVTPATQIVLNIPLCAFTEENGSTEVWPGTHKIVDTPDDAAIPLEERAQGLSSVRANLPLGSFLLRDLRVWHRGTPNRADASRTMLAIVFRRPFIATKTTTIPQSTWDGWSARTRRIYRENPTVPDKEHRAQTW